MKAILRIAAASIAMLVFVSAHAQLSPARTDTSATESSKQALAAEHNEHRAKIKASIAAKKARPGRANNEEKADSANKGNKSPS